jgi:hypothetical protein
MNSKATPTTHRIRAVQIVVKDVAHGVWKSNEAADAQVGIELLMDMFVWTLAFHDVRLPTSQGGPLSLNPLVLGCGNRAAGSFNLSHTALHVFMVNDLTFSKKIQLTARSIGVEETEVDAWAKSPRTDVRGMP